jgi:2-iminoacetate synthase
LSSQIVRQAEEVRRRNFGDQLCLHSVIYPIDYCTSGCTYCGLSSLLAAKGAHGSRGAMRPKTFSWLMENLVGLGYHVHELVFGTVVEDQEKLADLVARWVEQARELDPAAYIIVNCDTLKPAGYRRLKSAGADAVWTFIETMSPENYRRRHRFGLKADRAQRMEAPGRMRDADLDVGNALLWGLSLDWQEEFDRFVEWSAAVGGFDFVATPVQQPLTLPKGTTAPVDFDVEPPMHVSEELYLEICAHLRLAFPNAHLVANTRLDPRFVYGKAARITDMSNGYVWTGSVSHPKEQLAEQGRVQSESTQMDFFNPGADLPTIQSMCAEDISVKAAFDLSTAAA